MTMSDILAASGVSPAALWVGIALVAIAVLVFAKTVVRVLVTIVTAVVIAIAKTNGLL